LNIKQMYSIALLVPICSRNQNYKTIEEIPFLKYLLPSFLKTYNPSYKYTFYIGIDDTDTFYMENYKYLESIANKNINIQSIILQNCEHKPAHAWNKLFEVAYNLHDYFYQVGDDIIMLDPWVDRFIDTLSKRDNLGVVGGCNDINYYGRVNCNKSPIIENAFVHQKHYHIFKIFFNKKIENWYCDDWITEVYKPNNSTICIDIKLENKVYDRYKIKPIGDKIRGLIKEDKKLII